MVRKRLSLFSRITFYSKHIKNISIYRAINTGSELKAVRKTLAQQGLQRKIHMELGRKANQVMLFRKHGRGGRDMEGEVILLAQRSSLVSKRFELHIENPSLGI